MRQETERPSPEASFRTHPTRQSEETMLLSRRTYLRGTASVLVASTAGCLHDDDDELPPQTPPERPTSPTSLQTGAVGCYQPAFAGAQSQQFGCGLRQTSGDFLFDQRFVQEVSIQGSFWRGVPASVFLFDECSPQQGNAYATPEGLIMMGLWFMQRTVVQTGSELPIAGIMAHEWGHQIQFRFGWMVQTEPTVRRTELEADMWSGLYMALFKSWTGLQMQSYFQTLFSIGDYNFNYPGHHGTPQQRLAAGGVGFEVARGVASLQVPFDYGALHAIFVREVTRITTTIQSAPVQPLGSGFAYPAADVYENLDRDWIDGIVAGTRTLAEAGSIRLSANDRLNLAPYVGGNEAAVR